MGQYVTPAGAVIRTSAAAASAVGFKPVPKPAPKKAEPKAEAKKSEK